MGYTNVTGLKKDDVGPVVAAGWLAATPSVLQLVLLLDGLWEP
jgi:hypothetical protein